MKNKYILINGVCLLLVMFFICAQQANAKLLTVKTEKEGTLAEKSLMLINGILRS